VPFLNSVKQKIQDVPVGCSIDVGFCVFWLFFFCFCVLLVFSNSFFFVFWSCFFVVSFFFCFLLFFCLLFVLCFFSGRDFSFHGPYRMT